MPDLRRSVDVAMSELWSINGLTEASSDVAEEPKGFSLSRGCDDRYGEWGW